MEDGPQRFETEIEKQRFLRVQANAQIFESLGLKVAVKDYLELTAPTEKNLKKTIFSAAHPLLPKRYQPRRIAKEKAKQVIADTVDFTSDQDRYSLPPAPVHSRVVELSENSLYCPSSSTARESSFTTDSEAACEMEMPTFDALYMTDDNEPLALRWIAIFKANTSTQSDIVNMGKVANILASEKFDPEHLNHDTGASLIDEFISPLLKAAIPSMGVYAKFILALRSLLNGGGKCADASKSKRNLSTEDTKTAGTKRTGGSTKRTGYTSLTKEEASGDDDGDVDVDSPLGDHNTKPA
ncbi:hypothetical protein CEUSTIGMA_g13342.t1 [Chlamydomonas eustigma]|uniref:Uncharacterized protein n=1 Tax=Chlamydomonas eustigma TaxID=1157962 RepID=A0A250XSB1_9CHLO|nr:hypothetical protein CEUSTIGMA_g13342.t1 [Chlamydomonas eustigma]|eukprot:GAX85926.1 hypothetical protein CEUSTIGMA_g13342.t1 [Chlamydomonas eustigma]